MTVQKYSVTPHPIETILTWVKSQEIAVPEIQRPFVWDAVQVRNLLDSLYNGFPVGYLIVWRNPTIRLKDGTLSAGKRILIDGQQRVTALLTALLGQEVISKDYERIRIRIAFHPMQEKFEVQNSAIQNDRSWIPDIAEVFSPDARLLAITNASCKANPGVDEDELFGRIERLRKIVHNHVGVIELDPELDIETVTEIFIRVNSAGTTLSQADFAMSKIAADEKYGGAVLRKTIDYFCHLAVHPDFAKRIEEVDPPFTKTEFWQKIRWLKDETDDLFDPTYTDVLRVAFTSKFRRGHLKDLVALLSGRNFETKKYEEAIAEESFSRLREGVLDYVNKTHFNRLLMILRSAGFIRKDLVGSQNAVNFAYILYLRAREEGMPAGDIERLVRRWYAMSVLKKRYTGNPENVFDYDIRHMDSEGIARFTGAILESELPDTFWTGMLPQLMVTSSPISPYFQAFKAAQVKMGDKAFLSGDISVQDILLHQGDIHHVFPREYLKAKGYGRGDYNQVANFVVSQSEINIKIGKKSPYEYFAELRDQVRGGRKVYGNIVDEAALRENLERNCIPQALLDGVQMSYEEFLGERRRLMALKLKRWFESL